MIVLGENLPAEWSEELNVAWTFDVEGEGWASPITWGNQVFVASTVAVKINKPGEGEGEQENQDLYLQDVYRWELTCLEAETGAFVYQEKVEKVAACWASPWINENKIFLWMRKVLPGHSKQAENLNSWVKIPWMTAFGPLWL